MLASAATEPLWNPSATRVERASLSHFRSMLAARSGPAASSYEELWRFSITEREQFWSAVWDYCEVLGDKGREVCRDRDRLPGAQWFPDGSLNFAENLLR